MVLRRLTFGAPAGCPQQQGKHDYGKDDQHDLVPPPLMGEDRRHAPSRDGQASHGAE